MSNLTDFKVPPARALTAGNGLTGGGTLQADRTFTLGTPGTLTVATANAVTATSHTHELDLNLGTAANANLTTSQTDTTAGRVLKVGDFGVGSVSTPLLSTFSDAGLPNGFYTWSSSTTDSPNSAGGGAIKLNRAAGTAMWIAFESSGSTGSNEPIVWFRNTSNGTNDWGPWRKGAFDHRQVIAGDGLSGGGTIAADRTFDVDSTVVRTTGNQTLGGTKTFSSTIAGSINGNAATVTNGVYTTGNQTIGGTKTFSSTIAGSINGNAATVTNGVYTTGNQTIAGVKTFSSNPVTTHETTARGMKNITISASAPSGTAVDGDVWMQY